MLMMECIIKLYCSTYVNDGYILKLYYSTYVNDGYILKLYCSTYVNDEIYSQAILLYIC